MIVLGDLLTSCFMQLYQMGSLVHSLPRLIQLHEESQSMISSKDHVWESTGITTKGEKILLNDDPISFLSFPCTKYSIAVCLMAIAKPHNQINLSFFIHHKTQSANPQHHHKVV